MNFRTTRIIATLGAIVFTTMQPMSVRAIAGLCADDVCAAKQMCGGCGRCEVEHQGDQCCCCRHSEQRDSHKKLPSYDSSTVLTTSAPEGIHSRCTCGVSVPPMNRATPRDRLVRERTVRIASLDFVAFVVDTPPAAMVRVIDATTSSRADFAQRFLCVWRI